MIDIDATARIGALVALRIARERDTLIGCEITDFLGTADWTVDAVTDRMSMLEGEGRSWIYTLDKVPIIQIWPVTSSLRRDGDITNLVWKFNYRSRSGKTREQAIGVTV